jgi:hypothetical protein
VAHDIRDAIMDFIAHWSERSEIGALQLVTWIGLSRSKFYSWRDRYGKANEHNALSSTRSLAGAVGKGGYYKTFIINSRWKVTAD